MATAQNGTVQLYYETFGDPADPALVLVNGLGSQCINYRTEWVEQIAAEGFHVVRFDNRDVGLSTHLTDDDPYTVDDMAEDLLAVIDAVCAERTHLAGGSMGGMIVQAFAIAHPERLLSLTSIMSTTGDPDVGQSDPDVLKILLQPEPTTRSEYRWQLVQGAKAYGSPDFLDEVR